MSHRAHIGRIGEALAKRYALSKQYIILRQNFRVRGGEIDLIALEGECLVCIEVKTRTSGSFGRGAEALSPTKKRLLRRALSVYLQQESAQLRARGIRYATIRCDVIELLIDAQEQCVRSLRHYKNIALS